MEVEVDRLEVRATGLDVCPRVVDTDPEEELYRQVRLNPPVGRRRCIVIWNDGPGVPPLCVYGCFPCPCSPANAHAYVARDCFQGSCYVKNNRPYPPSFSS